MPIIINPIKFSEETLKNFRKGDCRICKQFLKKNPQKDVFEFVNESNTVKIGDKNIELSDQAFKFVLKNKRKMTRNILEALVYPCNVSDISNLFNGCATATEDDVTKVLLRKNKALISDKFFINEAYKTHFLEGAVLDIDRMQYNFSLLNDSKVADMVRAELAKTNGDDIDSTKKIYDMVNNALELCNTFNGKTCYIGDAHDIPYYRRYYNSSKKINPDIMDKYKKVLKGEDIYLTREEKTIISDLQNELTLDRLKTFCKSYPDNKLSNYFYNEYYLKFLGDKVEGLQDMCRYFNEKYNVKVFLSSDLKDVFPIFKYMKDELAEWKRVGGKSVIFPPIIDFSKIKPNYIDANMPAGGMCDAKATKAISIDGNDFFGFAYTIRHELTHANDLKLGENIDKKYDLNKIMPKIKVIDKDGVEHEEVDFENCMYKEEFRNTGRLSESQIKYAYKNVKEFIAVASEGDMTKYSPEFKEMLVAFGMPRWELNIENLY